LTPLLLCDNVTFEDKERAVEPRCAPDVLPVAAENPWNAPRAEESVVISMMGFTLTRERS
jgi:hypothetical protein